MRRHLFLALAVGAAAALGGCFDVEQSVSLQRDLSGTANFSVTLDLEPVFVFIAGTQHSMLGKSGELTPAEIEQARRDFLAALQKQDHVKKQQETAAWLEQGLPAGVRLLSSSFDDQGTKVALRCQLAFDDVHKLPKIKLPEKGGEPGQNPWSDPFATLQVVDEGPTMLVTFGYVDAAARLQEQAAKGGPPIVIAEGPPATPEMSKALAGAFKTSRFAFRLDSPFEVVETNASRRDGRTLYWEPPADPNARFPQTLTARLKK